MSRERMERRLAAILAADVAGYSRLMGTDEEGTLAQLKTHRREMVDPKISEYGGRIVKTAGDGMLVESARQSPTRVVRRDAPAVTRSRSLPVPLYMINEAEYIRQFGY